jgi:isoquinoline 1-oxidoreductase alpha subunit
MFKVIINGNPHEIDDDGDTPLLWALRDSLGLTGTKFGCGAGLCGACTVLFDGSAVRSCQISISDCAGHSIHTIEATKHEKLHQLQAAWTEEDVPQCGYCQPGQIMAAASLLSEFSHPSDKQIDAAMTNICRCGTYDRIRKAIHRAATSSEG